MEFLNSNLFMLICFVGLTALVALISWWKSRDENLKSEDGYYLAGRSLTAAVICGSLVMTDLSAEQLIGNNGQSVFVGIGTFAQQSLSWTGLAISAILLTPVFLKMGVSTVPEFFEKRYDKFTRRLISVIFICSFIFIMMPSCLYCGAQVFVNLFDIDELLGISTFAAIVIVCILTAIIGSIYAIFGGLKAITVSDTINGIGMIIGGVLIPIFGMIFLSNALGGDGSFLDGVDKFLHTDPAMMNAWCEWDSAEPWAPWPMLLAGLLIQNTYFWGANQSIMQRAFGAKNLAEAQKGILWTGLADIAITIFIVVPGVIAALAFPGMDWGNGDSAFPVLMGAIMPKALQGFFAACIFGAVLSSFNSVLNSASTMFSLDFYKPVMNPDADDEKVVKVGKIFGGIVAVISTVMAPFLMYMSGVTNFINIALLIFSTPVLIMLLFGMFNKRTPRNAAKIVIPIHIVIYVLFNYVLRNAIPLFTNIHTWYFSTFMAIVDSIIVLALTKLKPMETPFEAERGISKDYDMTPWKYRNHFIALCAVITIVFYTVFSPIGLGKSDQTTWERHQAGLAVTSAEVVE